MKHDLEKSKLQDLQLAHLQSQRMLESSSTKPLGSKTDGDDSAISYRGNIASAGKER